MAFIIDEERYKKLQADLHSAISKVINDYEDEATYLTRYVVLCEVVDFYGDRAVWQVAADKMMAWDTLGLLEYARSTEWSALYSSAISPEK